MDINYIELKVKKKKSIKHRKWSKNKIKTTTTYNMYVIITLIQCKFDLWMAWNLWKSQYKYTQNILSYITILNNVVLTFWQTEITLFVTVEEADWIELQKAIKSVKLIRKRWPVIASLNIHFDIWNLKLWWSTKFRHNWSTSPMYQHGITTVTLHFCKGTYTTSNKVIVEFIRKHRNKTCNAN